LKLNKPSYLILLFFFAPLAVAPVVANEPPVLNPIGSKTAIVDLQLSFEVSASDPDGTPPFLLPPSPMPPGAKFGGFVADSNTRTGTFKWTPDSTQVGTYYVTFYAWDGDLFDSEMVTIDVEEPGYDPGIRDTVELIVTMQPDSSNNQLNVELGLYVFNDSTVAGATAGFFWDNSNLLLDSAKPSDLTSAGFDGGTFFYRGDDIDSSNFYRQFIFGGYAQTAPGVSPTLQRCLWATYYFSLSSWSATDSIVVDSTLVPPSNYLLFTVHDTLHQRDFVPHWNGKVVVKDASDVTVIGGSSLPGTYSLSQNYPNPFNPITEIGFEVPIRSHVTLTVYNILGQKVTTLVDKELAPNSYIVDWGGTSDDGSKVATGIYFYRLAADDFIETKKMLLLK